MQSLYPNTMVSVAAQKEGTEVAIIMRTMNRPILLMRALSSVLQQQHQNWHLYLVNDGGDEKQLEKHLEAYRQAFGQRLTVIHHESNRGMEAASNSGLERAKGDFVIVHDDDDSWHPAFLKITVDFLNKEENKAYAAVCTNCEVVQEELGRGRITEKSRSAWGFFQENISFQNLLSANNTPPIALLIRKSVVDAVGEFNSSLPVLGDWDYILRVIQVGDIGTIDRRLAYYHHRISSRDDNYNNTVTAGLKRHHKYNVLYRNALLRASVRANPEMLGILQLISLQEIRMNEILHWNNYHYTDLKKKIKYSGLFGKLRLEFSRFKNKVFKKG